MFRSAPLVGLLLLQGLKTENESQKVEPLEQLLHFLVEHVLRRAKRQHGARGRGSWIESVIFLCVEVVIQDAQRLGESPRLCARHDTAPLVVTAFCVDTCECGCRLSPVLLRLPPQVRDAFLKRYKVAEALIRLLFAQQMRVEGINVPAERNLTLEEASAELSLLFFSLMCHFASHLARAIEHAVALRSEQPSLGFMPFHFASNDVLQGAQTGSGARELVANVATHPSEILARLPKGALGCLLRAPLGRLARLQEALLQELDLGNGPVLSQPHPFLQILLGPNNVKDSVRVTRRLDVLSQESLGFHVQGLKAPPRARHPPLHLAQILNRALFGAACLAQLNSNRHHVLLIGKVRSAPPNRLAHATDLARPRCQRRARRFAAPSAATALASSNSPLRSAWLGLLGPSLELLPPVELGQLR